MKEEHDFISNKQAYALGKLMGLIFGTIGGIGIGLLIAHLHPLP